MVSSFYFTAGNSLFKVKKVNTTWNLIEHQTNWDLMCVAIDPMHNNRIYVGTFDHGLKISDDGGETWKSAGDGISYDRIMSVAISPIEKKNGFHIIWVGTEPSSLFRSEDGGDSWTSFPKLLDLPSRSTWSFPPRPHAHHVQSIQPDIYDENKIFVGIELGGVMKSEDKGETWEDRKPNSQYDCHNLTMNISARNRLYEAAGGGYAESRDGGDTWKTFNDGLGSYTYLYDIAVDPNDPDTMIASAAENAQTAYMPTRAKTILVRREKGQPWKTVQKGLPQAEGSSVFSLLSYDREAGVFYAVNNLGIYRSQNAGKEWERIPVHWPDHLKEKRIRGFIAL